MGHARFPTPYVDQTPLYNAVNMSLPNRSRENTTVVSGSVEAYLCPSDEKPRSGRTGFANFQKCHGSGLFPRGLDANAKPSSPRDTARTDGFFGEPPIRERDVADGLSQTAAMSEMIHGAN